MAGSLQASVAGHQPSVSGRSLPGRQLAAAAWWIGLVAVVGGAALLRFYALPSRGLIYWDEGKFTLEGLRLQVGLQHLFGGGAVIAGKAVGTAKPTHALLIALAYLVFGVHDYSPLLLDAACSVSEVVVLYLIARRLFGPGTALLGAGFLAVSEYDVIYARSALSESDANLMLLGGVLIWTGSRPDGWRGLALAGLLMGLSFTTNYRIVVYIAALVAFDLIWVWRHEGLTGAVRRLPPWLGGLAAAPVAWQLVDFVARARGFVMFRNELSGAPRWYLAQVLYQLHEGRQSTVHVSPGPYIHWYLLRAGWPLLILLLMGLAVALWRRSFPWLAMAVPVVVPYVVYVFAPFIVPRNLDPALPFSAVLCAAALIAIARWIRARQVSVALLSLLAAVLLGLGAHMTWGLTAERSGYARAAAYVIQHGRGLAAVSSEVMVFYLRGSGPHCTAPEIGRSARRLAADARAGYRYAVLDHYSWRVARLIRARMRLAARFSAAGQVSLGENLINTEHGPPSRYRVQEVDVYDLDPANLPPPRGVRPDVCSRELV